MRHLDVVRDIYKNIPAFLYRNHEHNQLFKKFCGGKQPLNLLTDMFIFGKPF